jgi:hypothetical protein
MFVGAYDHSFIIAINKTLRFVDELEEFVEGFSLTWGDLLEVNISTVAQDLCEEMIALLIIEQMVLRVVTNLTMLVNPLQKQSLVSIEVWLLHKQGP